MKTLNIVLLEPRIPENAGNIARTCAVTGARLHLIRPFGFEITDKHLKRAGLDFTSKGPRRHTEVDYPDNCYLFFGREDAGLPEELLLKNQQSCVRMPMRQGVRCLNLSNAVAVGVYEVLRQWNFEDLESQGQLTRYTWKESNQ